MGIDYDAKVVFGWSFEYEEYVQKTKDIEDFSEWIEQNYPEFETGSTSPYYDCNIENCDFYLSFRNFQDLEVLKTILDEIKSRTLLEHPLLRMLEISSDPELFGLVDVY